MAPKGIASHDGNGRRVELALIVAGLGLGLLSGCASVGLDAGVEAPLEVTRRVESHYNEQLLVWAALDGTRVRATASQRCDVRTIEVERLTRRRNRVNDTPETTIVFGVSGGVGAALGIGLAVDAGHVYDDDKTSRTYNQYGPTTASIVAGTVLGLGIALGTIAVVDAIRTSGSEVEDAGSRERVTATREGECDSRPTEGVEFIARITTAGGLPLAKTTTPQTDTDGQTSLDLSDLFISAYAQWPNDNAEPAHASLQLLLENAKDQGQGAVVLPLELSAFEPLVWKSLGTATCLKPKKPTDCDDIARYLRYFPEGANASSARKILAAGAGPLALVRDDAHWRSTESVRCAALDAASCELVEAYLDAYPSGRHAPEARRLVERNRRRQEALREREAREARRLQREQLVEAQRVQRASVWASDVIVTIVTQDRAGYSVGVEFVATLNRRKGYGYFHGTARCDVGSRTFVDRSMSLIGIDDVRVGESRSIPIGFFWLSPLRARPDRCEISITLGSVLRGDELVTLFCYESGNAVRGRCSG